MTKSWLLTKNLPFWAESIFAMAATTTGDTNCRTEVKPLKRSGLAMTSTIRAPQRP